MNFFEGVGIFIVALVAFFIFSFLLGAIFTTSVVELIYVGAWISGSVVYAITVVIVVYISSIG